MIALIFIFNVSSVDFQLSTHLGSVYKDDEDDDGVCSGQGAQGLECRGHRWLECRGPMWPECRGPRWTECRGPRWREYRGPRWPEGWGAR